VKELASPFSTGSGGANFEAKVQAAFVAAMLAGAPAPCVPSGSIELIRLQARQSGYETDDVLIIVNATPGTQHRLLVQIKHRVAFSASDQDFRETLIAAWHDFHSPENFDQAKDAIALATGPHSANAIDHVRPVLEWTRHSDSADEFFHKVEAEGFSADAKRSFIRAVREILKDSQPPPSDDSLWRFLRVLHLLPYDYDVDHGHDEARVLLMLHLAKSPECSESIDGLWAQIIELTCSYNQNAGTITRASLPAALAEWPVLDSAFSKAPALSASPVLRRLEEHSALTLGNIPDEFSQGVQLERRPLVDAALDCIEQSQVTLITGDAGYGKSVLAKMTLKRLAESEGMPTFAFRVEELDAAHLDQALTSMGITDNLAQLSARFAVMPHKLLFIDSVERLFELRSTDAFSQLLAAVAQDPTWRLVLACRSHSTDLIVTHFLEPKGLSAVALEVPVLSDDELAAVAAQMPNVRPYVSDCRLNRLLRVPIYLRIACRSGAAQRATQAGISLPLSELQRLFWQEAVERPTDQQSGMPRRRSNAFIEISVRRAKAMRPFIRADDQDPEALQRLLSDGLLATDERGQFAPSQDLFEDWALYEYIGRCFEITGAEPLSFFERIGAEPAVRRAFRRWLGQAIARSHAAQLKDFILNAVRSLGIPQYWRDEIIVASLLSEAATEFVDQIGPNLLEKDKALLKRSTHLLRTACKGPNQSFLRSLGVTSGAAAPWFSMTFTKPIGDGWVAIIKFIRSHLDSFGLPEAGMVQRLLSDWVGALDLNAALPPEAKDVAELAYKYFIILTDDSTYGDAGGKAFLEILLKVPHAIPHIINELYREDAAASSRHSRSISRRLELADQLAIQSFSCVMLCEHFPQVVMNALERRIWLRPSEDWRTGHDLGTEVYFGIAEDHHLSFYPPSPLQGPFVHLLNYHPETAFEFLLSLVERACRAYVQSGLDKNSVQKVKIRLIDGSEREISASIRLWCLYRGTQVGPHLLVSVLMAIEDWLLRCAEAGAELSSYFQKVYELAVSAAPLAVLASVACAAPDAAGETVLPLLGTLFFYYLDLNRQLLETHRLSGTLERLGGHRDPMKDVQQAFLKKCDEREHRKTHLEELTLKLSLGPLRPRIASLIDSMKEDIDQLARDGTPSDALIPYRMTLKRIDLREHDAKQITGGYVLTPKIVEPDLRAATEQSRERMELASRVWGLCTWASTTFEGRASSDETTKPTFDEWAAALTEAMKLEETSAAQEHDEETVDHRYLRVLGSVAACVIRDHRKELTREQASWCFQQILDAVQENADTADDTVQVATFPFHGSRPAAAVLPLLLDICEPEEIPRVRAAIAIALTHAVREVRSYAVEGARAWLWERDRAFAAFCLKGMFRFAAKRRQALDSIRKRGDGRATPSFDAVSRHLGRELRAQLAAFDPTINAQDDPAEDLHIGDFIEDDLLAALTLIPAYETDPKYRSLFISVMNNIIDAEEAENKSRSENRERIRYEFLYGFSTLFAKYLLHQDVQGDANDLLSVMVAAIQRAPKAAAMILKDLVVAEINESIGDRFWYIWSRCAEEVYTRMEAAGSRYVVGFIEAKTLVRTILFADTPWKREWKQWHELEEHKAFVQEAFQRVGNTPPGFAALLRLLNTVGASLLPDALIQLNDARAQCDPSKLLEEQNAQYDLELVLRDCVLSMGTELRTRDILRRAALELLNVLVDRGSSLAFQLRELIVAPMSAA
jgi:hypothetical protein